MEIPGQDSMEINTLLSVTDLKAMRSATLDGECGCRRSLETAALGHKRSPVHAIS
jgi:hypothetical protein